MRLGEVVRLTSGLKNGEFLMKSVPEELTLEVNQQIEIDAPLETSFDALLKQLGPENQRPDGESLNMKIEPWPGGRWFRDLDGKNGHFWGHVQVIKRPGLLEICGPMFMSYPAISHIQFRLTPSGKRTVLTMQHRALGMIDPEHREGVKQGWGHMLKGVKKHAEH